MKRLSFWSTLIFLLVLVFAVSRGSDAFSLGNFLGLTKADPPATKAAADPAPDKSKTAQRKDWAKPSAKGNNDGFSMAYVQNLLANLRPGQRKKLLSDKTLFHNFVETEANAMAVLEAAKANKVQDNADVRFLMERAAQNVLREIYLNKIIANKIPSDFPSEKQVEDYYNKNKSKFVIGERMHIWQIYLPLGKNLSKKQRDEVEKKADRIEKELKDGKMTFAQAALKYSDNPASRYNGGYMGLVEVSKLKPGIQAPLLALSKGKISAPVKTEDGIHIFRRGDTVPGRNVSLDEVKPQVRRLLINEMRKQLIRAVYAQARKTYPIALTDDQVEQWRHDLSADHKNTGGKPGTVKSGKAK